MDADAYLDERVQERADSRITTFDWTQCVGREPPPIKWAIRNWLSMHSTLIAGRGAIGKTLLAQCVGTALATGQRYIDDIDRPYVVGLYLCEDDVDEVWRRQLQINRYFGLEWADLGSLHITVRVGHSNTLFEPEFGVLRFTSAFNQLREWVLDLGIEYLFLDNVSQTYAGPTADNGAVTRFVNGVRGIWTGEYPGAPVFLAHPARAQGSEYSGAAAWENACRMRWWLDDKPPDTKSDDVHEMDSALRYLAKRKVNYGERDLIRLTYSDGVLIPDEFQGKPFSAKYQAERAESIVLTGMRKLLEMKQHPSDGTGANYLPKLLTSFDLHEGIPKKLWIPQCVTL